MGLLNSVGIGIGTAAQAAQPFILNMQQAEIQKLRDERMAEIAKGAAEYSSELSLKNEQTLYERKQAREPEETAREISKKGLLFASEANLEKEKWNDPEYRKAQSLKETITNPDRDAEGRALRNEAAKLTNEEAKKESTRKDTIKKLLEQRAGVATKFTGEGRTNVLADIDAKLAALGYEQKGSKWSESEITDEFGETKTIKKREGVGNPPSKGVAITREQVRAAAAAQGITDPKKLEELYAGYGV